MFDPLELLEVAGQLGASPASEKSLRSAINRAYFAIHLKAELALSLDGVYTRRGNADDHGGVIAALRGPARRRQAGEFLDELRRLRNAADYSLDHPTEPSHWDDAKRYVAEIRRVLDPDWQKQGLSTSASL